MRAIFILLLILFSTAGLSAQSIFDTASCGGVNNLTGFSADTIFAKSREWITKNIYPLNYTDNKTNGTIIITALEDYNAKASDKLPERYSGKFEYNLIITAKDGYYSYDFVNVKYIPKDEVKDALTEPEKSNAKAIKIKKKTWDKISRSAFRQLQDIGKKYDAFMQLCKV